MMTPKVSSRGSNGSLRCSRKSCSLPSTLEASWDITLRDVKDQFFNLAGIGDKSPFDPSTSVSMVSPSSSVFRGGRCSTL